jgi:hypothetical protein
METTSLSQDHSIYLSVTYDTYVIYDRVSPVHFSHSDTKTITVEDPDTLLLLTLRLTIKAKYFPEIIIALLKCLWEMCEWVLRPATLSIHLAHN